MFCVAVTWWVRGCGLVITVGGGEEGQEGREGREWLRQVRAEHCAYTLDVFDVDSDGVVSSRVAAAAQVVEVVEATAGPPSKVWPSSP